MCLVAVQGKIEPVLIRSAPSLRPNALPMNLPTWFVLLDIAVVVVLTARRLDVRLALLLGAVPLFAASAGGMADMLAKMTAEMSNPATIVPIGSALGFAYVLRMTECDREMVRLMLRPLRRLPALLIPGGIIAGYLVNTTIVSQSGTAAVLGPILIPLLRAGGLAPATAGAVLLLGSSMGGELFNPGAVEMRKLSDLTGLGGDQLVQRQAPLNFIACGTALLVFWILARRQRRQMLLDGALPETPAPESNGVPIHLFKAVVPILPLVLLFIDTMTPRFSVLTSFDGPTKILAAILVGVILAGLAAPRVVPRLGSSFFEGAGYSYTYVISLIVAASTFAEGVRRSGLIEILVRALANQPAIAPIATVLIPWALGVLCGSGIAPAIAIMEFFVPAAESLGLDPVQLGTLASLGAHFGRTMSPAAAVVAMSSRLSDAPPGDLIRRVVVPLLVGMAVMIAAAILEVV